jgi:hypothetical protein
VRETAGVEADGPIKSGLIAICALQAAVISGWLVLLHAKRFSLVRTKKSIRWAHCIFCSVCCTSVC